jgi:hypothetical protein
MMAERRDYSVPSRQGAPHPSIRRNLFPSTSQTQNPRRSNFSQSSSRPVVPPSTSSPINTPSYPTQTGIFSPHDPSSVGVASPSAPPEHIVRRDDNGDYQLDEDPSTLNFDEDDDDEDEEHNDPDRLHNYESGVDPHIQAERTCKPGNFPFACIAALTCGRRTPKTGQCSEAASARSQPGAE